ncbi:MAG TPA: nitroreductase family protein [Dehalococcoidia bacterium]|nr:nitroreductase family protein [Dehalococcoidia bacterium]
MPEREQLDVLEAIHSTPARRYLKPDPIPDDVLWELLDAAIRGPSGGNQQGWGWIVVRDAETKRQIAEWYLEGWTRVYGEQRKDALSGNSPLGRANYLSADHLANNLEEAPVWVMPVMRGAGGGSGRGDGSIYGAVQNLMLAASAHGIGATLTTLYGAHEDDVRKLLGLPDDAATMGLIPLGYPARGRWAQPKRLPVDEVTHWEQWGEQRAR